MMLIFFLVCETFTEIIFLKIGKNAGLISTNGNGSKFIRINSKREERKNNSVSGLSNFPERRHRL